MKFILLLIFIALLLASLFTYRRMPESVSARPILYWVTDANPAREAQIDLFHLWQVKHGHSVAVKLDSVDAADTFLRVQSRLMRASLEQINPQLRLVANGTSTATVAYPITVMLPMAEMRTDSANSELTKRVIQGVSGVGGDVMDAFSGQTMRQLNGIGLLRDVTDSAQKLGFGPEKTYAAITPEICIPASDGSLRQYMFPCNVTANGYVVNVDAFEKHGLPTPPARWTIAEFERIGAEYVQCANAGLPRTQFYFVGAVDQSVLRRTFGADVFNETMTAANVDHPGAVEAAKTFLRWQNELRIVPTAAERAGFSTDSGYSGNEPQLFHSGNFALVFSGRYLLIQLRQFNIDRVRNGRSPMKLALSEPPHDVIPVTNMSTRGAAVYAGGKHHDLAELFLTYLASEDYSALIVRDADSLPPNPEFLNRKEYFEPTLDASRGIYPESENGLHRPFKEFAETIGVATSHSPFILTLVAQREVLRAEEAYVDGNVAPAEALAGAKRRIDAEIARNISENPTLRPLFEQKIERQLQIDAMKAKIAAYRIANPGAAVPEDLKVPSSMIDNPFYRVLYEQQGMARDDSAATEEAAR